MKLDFDIEKNILEWVRATGPSQCAIISDCEGSTNYNATIKVLETILTDDFYSRWKDNTSTSSPPDFINEQDRLMMEIMRFDDHSTDGKKNPNLAKQRKMLAELEPYMHLFPNAKHIYLNPDTGLPTEQDHNYRFYWKGFKRTVTKHIRKISNYRECHPNKKLIFLVFDESSGIYFERMSGGYPPNLGRLHFPFLDRRFIECFEKADLDYLILFCPFNHYETVGEHLELPQLTIFDVRNMNSGDMLKRIDYDESRMVSSEK